MLHEVIAREVGYAHDLWRAQQRLLCDGGGGGGGLRFVLSSTLNILENFFIVNTRNKQTQFSQSKSVHKLGLEPLRRQQGCN